MRGIKALKESIGFDVFWDTDNHRDLKPKISDVDDWNAYQALRKEEIRRRYVRGNRFAFFGADDEAGNGLGDGLEVLSPSTELTKECDTNEDKGDWNNMSFVLRLKHGPVSIIFGGDAESKAWTDILAAYKAELTCTILKASHHGRRTGYVPEAVAAMKPNTAILSIADECEHEAREEYARHCKNVWSTYERGDITIALDGTATAKASFQHQII